MTKDFQAKAEKIMKEITEFDFSVAEIEKKWTKITAELKELNINDSGLGALVTYSAVIYHLFKISRTLMLDCCAVLNSKKR